MNVLHGFDGLRKLAPGCILSIGNFDGVHRGHQAILSLARELREKSPGSRIALATFEPHPFTVLRPERVPPRLTPREFKRELLEREGVDDLVELAPEPAVLGMPAETLWAMLRDEIRPSHLIEGAGFHFGKGRGGNVARLREWSAGTGIALHVIDEIDATLLNLCVVPASSTTIRWLIAYGRVRDAAICLGRPYALRGEVIKGYQRGRELGVPTANLNCEQQLVPDDGVYAGRCEIDGRTFAAAVSIGSMPTFGDCKRQVEAHLIGYSGDLYGRIISVELLDWLREQRKYSNLDLLKEQIARDVTQTTERAGENASHTLISCSENRMKTISRLMLVTVTLVSTRAIAAETSPLLVEAESFSDRGGWVLDTQFVHIMGSPYLMAHGLGKPVKDATTQVKFPESGTYNVFVRTKDWVARWKAPGQPGKFQLLIEGKPLETTFGTEGANWHWQAGGKVGITKAETTIALHDLTGFDGRCDAICFSKDLAFLPPNEPKALEAWRKKSLGLPDKPTDAGPFDLVVIGGGYAGMGAAISGARMGCKVALIQDRPVLGGNGSSEIRVWSQGGTTLGKYPKLGEIVEEFADSAKESPGKQEEFGDDKKEAIVRTEANIALFLNTQAFAVEMKDGKIAAVIGHNMMSGAETRFVGTLFADTTGHGTIGALAGADFEELDKGHMGMSNMWRWDNADAPQMFPPTPWALPLNMADFPYPNRGKAEWFWEGGFNRDPIKDLEYIRDWNFRAIFGAFNAMKNGDGKDKHPNARIEWVAFVGGNRESRLLRGDVVLTREDIINKRDFDDGCVASTWSIDLHVPKEQYAKKFPEDPFISKAIFDSRVDKKNGYPIPYRCFYSRNITNLFMAGRDISVDHGALGTVRVMRTCGMEGEVVGKAASICVKDKCLPREVYYQHLAELKELMNLPGRARRATVNDKIDPEAPLPEIASHRAARRMPGGGETKGLNPKTLPGLVIDATQVKLTGEWSTGSGLPGFISPHYRYANPGKDEKTARFEFTVPASGKYEVRFANAPADNRASNASITVTSADGEKSLIIDEKAPSPLEHGFVSLGTFRFDATTAGAVTVTTKGANGIVAVNAVQVLPVK